MPGDSGCQIALMISLALQGEKFTSYFFCLIFAIFLSLKITVICKYVAFSKLSALKEHKTK